MRTTSPRMTQFDAFVESLYRENLRGFHELKAMQHGLSARLGLSESDALELAVKIVSADKQTKGDTMSMDNEIAQLQARLEYLKSVAEGKEFEQYMKRHNERPRIGDGFVGPHPDDARPPAFDVSAAQSKLDRLAAEHEELFSEPSRNYTRMQDIQGEMAKLRGQIAQHNRQHETARRETFSDELGRIERDIENLTEQSEGLMSNPSANQKKILEVNDQIAQRVNRRSDILSGRVEQKMEWNNDNPA